MDAATVILEGLRVILGVLNLLFIPGFVITLVYFPGLSDLRIIERLVYSTVLSIGSVIVLVLFMDVVMGINTTTRNISYFISAFSAFLLIVWVLEIWYLQSRLKERLDSLFSKDIRYFRRYSRQVKDSIADKLRRKP